MKEFVKIPWEMLFANFTWILGLSFILAALGFRKNIGYLQTLSFSASQQKKYYQKLFLGGFILFICGVTFSTSIYFLSPKEDIITVNDTIEIPPQTLEGSKTNDGDLAALLSNGYLKTKKLAFGKGRYTITIVAKGSKALDETAHLKIFLGFYPLADYFTNPDFTPKTMDFETSKKQSLKLIIEFDNDIYDQKKGLDRNVWIKSISIKKISSR